MKCAAAVSRLQDDNMQHATTLLCAFWTSNHAVRKREREREHLRGSSRSRTMDGVKLYVNMHWLDRATSPRRAARRLVLEGTAAGHAQGRAFPTPPKLRTQLAARSSHTRRI